MKTLSIFLLIAATSAASAGDFRSCNYRRDCNSYKPEKPVVITKSAPSKGPFPGEKDESKVMAWARKNPAKAMRIFIYRRTGVDILNK